MDKIDIIVIHYITIDSFFSDYNEAEQDQRGIKDVSLFESALYEPQQTFDKIDLYPDVLTKAACYLRSFALNHAFHNGNKRTALMAMIIFLELNEYEVIASHEKLMRLVCAVVNHTLRVYTIKNKYLKKYVRFAPIRNNKSQDNIRDHKWILRFIKLNNKR